MADHGVESPTENGMSAAGRRLRQRLKSCFFTAKLNKATQETRRDSHPRHDREAGGVFENSSCPLPTGSDLEIFTEKVLTSLYYAYIFPV